VLAWRGAKMTAKVLASLMKKAVTQIKKAKNAPVQGKQSVKKLIRQNAGVSNIEITDKNIKSFERVAKKYGVDFALRKDKSLDPPKWLVFFKARDADALTSAFTEFSAQQAKRSKKPSIISQLNKFKELIKNQVVDRTKNQSRGGHEL